MNGIQLGFAMCGSFCTFSQVVAEMEKLREKGLDIVPILSEAAYESDTRFGRAADWKKRVEELCGRPILHTLQEVEPIGPRALLDALVVAPCTGNTLAKLANGVTDSVVTMACKAHLRNARPLLLAVSTNDALAGNLQNIGSLLCRKNVYFVPFGQDDPQGKPTSLIADMSLIGDTVQEALQGRQLQPILVRK